MLVLVPLASICMVAAPATAGEPPRIENIEFVSHGVTLSGSIVFPGRARTRAAVVFVHGSGEQTRALNWAARFALGGIAALVYDKRGVGKSGGEYEGKQPVSEKNLSLLADDAVAAANALANHPSLAGVPVGLAGISQAGWIAPLAATRNSRVKFLVLWSGPVCKVSEEDIYSKYTADADLAVVPPYREALAARTEPYVWPDFLGIDTDTRASLARLTIPGFWIFSDNDASIPVDLSIAGLKELRDAGHHYDVIVYPGLGHNNMEGTFRAASDWIRKRAREL